MKPIFIPAETLAIVPGRGVDKLAAGVRVSAGGHGHVLYGPYCTVAAGVYRVSVDAALAQRADGASLFDMYANGRIQLAREYRNPFEVIALLGDWTGFEVRFRTRGEGVEVRSVRLQPLWLQAETSDTVALRELITAIGNDDVEPAALMALCDALAWAGEPALAESLRLQGLASSAGARVRQAWQSIHGAGAPIQTAAGAASRAQIAPIAAAEALVTFDLFSLASEDQAALRKHGYAPEWLDATRRHRAYADAQPRWRVARPPSPLSSPLMQAAAETDLSFQSALARGDGIVAYCPSTGAELRSYHGFLVSYASMSFIFYRFISTEVFYLCVGEASGGKSFLYFPRTSCVVLVMTPASRWYPKAELIYRLHMDVLSQAPLATRYLNGPTRAAAIISNNNLGHFIWNDLNGLHNALATGLGSYLALVVQLPARFLPVGAVFPEFADGMVRTLQASEAVVEMMAAGLLPIRFTEVVFYPDFSERLREAAARHVTAAGPPVEVVRPLIWINLRAHTKVWMEQVEAYSLILNAVHAEYGAVSAFLDGLADCADLAQAIRSRIDPAVTVYDGLTASLFDSIAWASKVDAYVCTIGSGLVLLTWIAAKEGVAHAETAHMEQLSWWGDVRPDAPPPLAPPLSAISNVDAGPWGTGLYCNYHLDAAEVLAPLRLLLDRKFPRDAPPAEAPLCTPQHRPSKMLPE